MQLKQCLNLILKIINSFLLLYPNVTKNTLFNTTLSVILKKLFIFTFMLKLRLFSKPIEMSKHLHGRCNVNAVFISIFLIYFFFFLFLFSTLYLYCPSTRWIFFYYHFVFYIIFFV